MNTDNNALNFKAGQKRPTVIPLPHLTLFATGIPKFVYGALNRKALENGLLGRCLFIENMCDMIEEETLSRRKTVFTLKTAA